MVEWHDDRQHFSLAAGSYTATITDAAGCVAVVLINIRRLPPVGSFCPATAVTSNGAQDGSITLTVIGGATLHLPPWSDGMTTANVTGFGGKTYFRHHHRCEWVHD
ncbi:MAG: SprB repeat-containing protein [Saprospiraceae bacterium]|nr:SprB repeat-containing protein [Saprospiraceae bacterium]